MKFIAVHKKTIFTSLFLLFTFSSFGIEGIETPLADEPSADVLSETIGHMIAKHLQAPGISINFEKVIQGIREAQEGKSSPLTEEEYEKAIASLQEKLFEQIAEKNLSAANAFLAQNAAASGIICLNEKIQYKVNAPGGGAIVNDDSTPLIHFTGTLLDGTVFADSRANDQPISLPLKQSIPGFNEGLVGMKEGEKRTLYIHPEKAYGVTGHLPPNSLLIFDVEIVKAQSDQDNTLSIQNELHSE